MTQTVLYIDDQFELPDRVDEILVQTGYELIHVSDPDEALRIVTQDRPALVLIELLLPDYDGFDLIQKMKRSEVASALPIIVVTRGERTPQLYGQALELGVEDFLCKPVAGAEILEALLEFAPADGPETSPASSSPPTVKSFEGRLAAQPLAGLLGRLYRAGASGVLRLTCGSETCGVQLRNGSPVEIEKHRNSASIADYLQRTGRIDGEQYEMLVDQLMARIAGPREILMGMEALSEEELVAANREQGLSVLLETFEWASGQFSFDSGERLESADTLELDCSPTEILRVGLKRTPDDVIGIALDRRSHLYVSFIEGAANRLDGHELSKEQRSQVESFMGDRTVAEVLASKAVDQRTLYGLHAMGAIQFGEAAILILDDELTLVEPEEARALPEAHVPARELPAQKLEVQPAPDAETPQAIESMLDELGERLGSEDDFELFEIDDKSSDAEARAAYDRLVESTQLGRIPDELEELKSRARAVSRRIDQAYQRVRSADMRRLFAGLRKKRKPVKQEEPRREAGARAVEAESWFRTGEGFLKREEWAQAVEAFGMAVHLDPEQGDYAACLGYSLYRSNPDNKIIQREALEHVAKGVKIAPDRERPLLFLSRIFRETGEPGMAAKVLGRALRLNPDSPALVQEMCLIDPGSSQSKRRKVLDRFRGR